MKMKIMITCLSYSKRKSILVDYLSKIEVKVSENESCADLRYLRLIVKV